MGEWMEIIRVLGSLSAAHAVQAQISGRVDETREAAGLMRAILMTKAPYGSDFGVVLVWNDNRQPAKTREGLVLAEYLRQFGSVDHAVWQVVPRETAPAGEGSGVSASPIRD